jgi:uncharacterized protein
MASRVDLGDYRRQVGDLYARVRALAGDPKASWDYWRLARRALFAKHGLSPLTPADREAGREPRYYDYDPAWRLLLDLDLDIARDVIEIPLQEDGPFRMERVGRIFLPSPGAIQTLSVFWILGYGGGLFLPFRDATNRLETFGGGRYLLDTIKGADLGLQAGRLVLDFNFSYNPSCAYSPQWQCPLPPAENWLTIPIPAGEKRFPAAEDRSPP